ncbi:MAG TPA: outer membrane protein transport protein [Pelobium sp.]|nr:outer membrane protein transport protein [Pelobium sp.]
MILNKKYFLAFTVLFAITCNAMAQSTINSPYSKFGVGNLKGSYLPQQRALGNLGYGISTVGAYQNLNISNPASYSNLRLTVFDIGVTAYTQTLNKGSLSQKSFNGSLSHLAIAVPVSKKSALSFGLLPYSNLGYEFKNSNTKVDTFSVDQIYKGEGGLTRAYLGYGFGLGKNFSLGVNMSYIFGNLKEIQSAEFPKYVGFLNSKTENNNSIGGLNFDFGAQYVAILNKNTKLTIGYTGGVKTRLETSYSQLITSYIVRDEAEIRVDSTSFVDEVEGSLTLPANHNFGFSIERQNKWLIGADLRLANWSDFDKTGSTDNLNDSWGFSVGGQITPNVNAVTNYLKLIDYRAGFSYDKSYVTIGSQDIDVKAINFGLGFPLISGRNAFYKINFATEIGSRGTLTNNLIKENFINFHLGFTINDRWFQKYKYD